METFSDEELSQRVPQIGLFTFYMMQHGRQMDNDLFQPYAPFQDKRGGTSLDITKKHQQLNRLQCQNQGQPGVQSGNEDKANTVNFLRTCLGNNIRKKRNEAVVHGTANFECQPTVNTDAVLKIQSRPLAKRYRESDTPEKIPGEHIDKFEQEMSQIQVFDYKKVAAQQFKIKSTTKINNKRNEVRFSYNPINLQFRKAQSKNRANKSYLDQKGTDQNNYEMSSGRQTRHQMFEADVQSAPNCQNSADNSKAIKKQKKLKQSEIYNKILLLKKRIYEQIHKSKAKPECLTPEPGISIGSKPKEARLQTEPDTGSTEEMDPQRDAKRKLSSPIFDHDLGKQKSVSNHMKEKIMLELNKENKAGVLGNLPKLDEKNLTRMQSLFKQFNRNAPNLPHLSQIRFHKQKFGQELKIHKQSNRRSIIQSTLAFQREAEAKCPVIVECLQSKKTAYGKFKGTFYNKQGKIKDKSGKDNRPSPYRLY